MAMLGELGNMSNTKVSNGFEPVPAGEYRAQVTETELKATKDGSGQLLKAKFEILDGEHAGKAIFTNYNLVNKNKQAEEIGKGQLKALATYSGHPNPNMIRQTEELHNRPVIIVVTIRPAKDGYDASNDIRSYKMVGAQSAAPVAPVAPKPPVASVAQVAPPVVAAPPSVQSAPSAQPVPVVNAAPVAAPAAVQTAPAQPAVQHQATTAAAPGGTSTDPVGNVATTAAAQPNPAVAAAQAASSVAAADSEIPDYNDPKFALLQHPPAQEYVGGFPIGAAPVTPPPATDLKAAAGF